MFKNIDTCLKWLENRRIKRNYNDFKPLINDLKLTFNDFKIIHITGTNGKGSIINFIKDALMVSGFKVGTFTSPHNITHLDRIRIDDINVDEDFFLNYINNNYQFIIEHNLSMFEIDFLIMYEYFKINKIDYALIEVGIGGLLDYSNVLENTMISIISNVSKDHLEILGNNKTAILKQKLGIVKPNSTVISGVNESYLRKIVKKDAQLKNSEVYFVEKIKHKQFYYQDILFDLEKLPYYQLSNVSVSLKCLEIIALKINFKFDYLKISNKFKDFKWILRYEILKENPLIIIDGAHNKDGVLALKKELMALKKKVTIIFSALENKDYLGMIESLSDVCDRIIVTTFKNKYNLTLNKIKSFGKIKTIKYFHKAYQSVKDDSEVIVFCGSLYFASEVRKYFVEGK